MTTEGNANMKIRNETLTSGNCIKNNTTMVYFTFPIFANFSPLSLVSYL